MKILVITQYYYPEPGATSNRLLSIVQAMVKRGHDVTVICEFPNHPTGILDNADRGKLFRVEKADGYRIIRTFVWTFPHKNNVKRMLFYLSFALSSLIAALCVRKVDVIFASSPPIFHAFTSMLASIVKRKTFILDIRDIWPDSALETQAVNNSTLLSLGSALEHSLYNKADRIFTISQGLKKVIDQRSKIAKTDLIYNGSFKYMQICDTNLTEFRKKIGWHDNVVILYAGIIGLGQDIIKLLPLINDSSCQNVRFEFIGGGPQVDLITNEIKKLNIDSIGIHEAMPVEKIIPFIHAADIMLVPLREIVFFKSAIPSKFFDYMAAGKPIVSNVDGELREIMEQYNTGIYFSIREPGSFDQAVTKLIENPSLRLAMGENGKKVVNERFLRSKLSTRMVEIIEKQDQS